jgi:hypothetical protein
MPRVFLDEEPDPQPRAKRPSAAERLAACIEAQEQELAQLRRELAAQRPARPPAAEPPVQHVTNMTMRSIGAEDIEDQVMQDPRVQHALHFSSDAELDTIRGQVAAEKRASMAPLPIARPDPAESLLMWPLRDGGVLRDNTAAFMTQKSTVHYGVPELGAEHVSGTRFTRRPAPAPPKTDEVPHETAESPLTDADAETRWVE